MTSPIMAENGDVFRNAGRTAEAQASYLESLEYQELIRKNATVGEYRERSLQALKGLGASQFTDRRFVDAVANWRKRSRWERRWAPRIMR